MEDSNYDVEKRDWLINIIIGIRKEVLSKLRALSDSFDREIYTTAQRNVISQEIREIAEMVSEKDSIMKKRENLNNVKYTPGVEGNNLIEITRAKVIELLNAIREGVLVIDYDGEYSIVDKELSDIESLVKNKDEIVHSKILSCNTERKTNPHVNKYFKISDAPEYE